ncbi:TetR/AcrR family transcriptional regulator [Alphaproteobacteria bacterium]|nr:TetR/AcrR family transcriptional regulator [Alphaproteobacteria bacterium]MDC0131303.1 TetR/AcrR family transcriptional regulator [Alphaproteobacteria bacterium]
MSSVVAINQRARTAEQKALRRRAVLEAAETYFLEVGYEAFSMSNLAKKIGVAKGTLYLYFETREEIFLTLYEQSLVRWTQLFIDDLPDTMTSQAYARKLFKTAAADGTFLPLLIRLEHLIEHNVAVPRLISSKQVFILRVDAVAEVTASSLGLSEAQATEVVKTMGVLLIGATQGDQGPSLDDEELPEDVQNLIASFSSEPLFIKNAVRIIEGIRMETISNI